MLSMRTATLAVALSSASVIAGANAATNPPASSGTAALPTVRTNAASSLPAPMAVPAPDYRIRPGDELALSVYGETEISRPQLFVDAGGRLTVGMIGEVVVAGQTADQAGQAIAVRLRQYVRNPVVTLAVLKAAPVSVTVLGNVAKPSKYLLDPSSRLIDAIGAAQGVPGDTSLPMPDAEISSPNGAKTTVSLERLLRDKNDISLNIPLTDGMTIYVPMPTLNIFIEGAVQRPGVVGIYPGDRLSVALARAGLGGNSEPDLNRITVRRIGTDGQAIVQTVNL